MSNVLTILKVIPASPEADREALLLKARNELLNGLQLEILKHRSHLMIGIIPHEGQGNRAVPCSLGITATWHGLQRCIFMFSLIP